MDQFATDKYCIHKSSLILQLEESTEGNIHDPPKTPWPIKVCTTFY